MSVLINRNCKSCGHRFMHNVEKACLCEYCLESPELIESRIADLEQQLEEARKDTERLDWCLEHCYIEDETPLAYEEKGKLYWNREAIDSARKEGECNGSGEPAQENNNE
jgi:hypothetical protein